MAYEAIPVVCEVCHDVVRVIKRRYRKPRLGSFSFPEGIERGTTVRRGRHKDIRKCLPRIIEEMQHRVDMLKGFLP
jgi:hypothetical protein